MKTFLVLSFVNLFLVIAYIIIWIPYAFRSKLTWIVNRFSSYQSLLR